MDIDWWERWGGSMALLGICFVSVTTILTVLDVYNPDWWRARLLRSAVKELDAKSISETIPEIMPIYIRNVMCSAIYVWFLWSLTTTLSPSRPWYTIWLEEKILPSIVLHGFLEILMINGLSQLWFWSAHRFVHSHPKLYKFIHAWHHRHKEPFALTGIDCTVSEMLVLNIPAVVFPLLILQPNRIVASCWVMLAAAHVPLAHSGHYLWTDDYHTIHHRDPRFNFGSIFLDRIFHTLYKEKTK